MSQWLFFIPLGGGCIRPPAVGHFSTEGLDFCVEQERPVAVDFAEGFRSGFRCTLPPVLGHIRHGVRSTSSVVATVFLTLWKRGCDICLGGLFCLTLKSSNDSATSLKSEADLQVLLGCFAGAAGMLWMGFGVGWDVLRGCFGCVAMRY